MSRGQRVLNGSVLFSGGIPNLPKPFLYPSYGVCFVMVTVRPGYTRLCKAELGLGLGLLKAAELDATLEATLKAEQLKLENENLQTELQELRRDLHESREHEARTVEEAQERIADLEQRTRGNGPDRELEKRRAPDS